MKTKEEIENKLKSIEKELKEEYFVKKIGLFGSFANNSFSDHSDIDFLVEFSKPVGWKFLTLNIYLEKIFNRKIDLVTSEAIRPEMKNDIYNNLKYIIS